MSVKMIALLVSSELGVKDINHDCFELAQVGGEFSRAKRRPLNLAARPEIGIAESI